MADGIKFVHIGLGPMGANICKLACQKEGFELVGAIEKVNLGQDAGEVIKVGKKLGVPLSDDLDAALALNPDIAVHSTLSSLEQVKDQLITIIRAGVNIVSTCEELSYPWETQTAIANELDTLAKENNVTLLGTGVNPGFCMDTFPIVATGICQEVRHIRVARIQDARSRRLPFQKKIGAGCTPKEFEELKQAGSLRHVGLEESANMVAAAMGWKIDEYCETIDPIMTEENEVSSKYMTVKPGQAVGVEQIAIGKMKGEEVIRMEFRAYLGAPESYDAVYITGTPDMEVVTKDGIHGDIATASVTVNAIPRVINALAGLLTMKDLPPVHAYAGDWNRLINN
ncbi:MAG: dihydrodipicolinate reductase [Deltaproteobacteria bacterium]|nr:dihydrodipicolinate reductase [Deltaproteobacteria bacterium]